MVAIGWGEQLSLGEIHSYTGFPPTGDPVLISYRLLDKTPCFIGVMDEWFQIQKCLNSRSFFKESIFPSDLDFRLILFTSNGFFENVFFRLDSLKKTRVL